MLQLGVTGGSRLKISENVDLPVSEITGAWSNGLQRALGD